MGRTDMLKPGDVLRLSEGGTLTRKEVSISTGVSTGTVSNILACAAAVGVSRPLPDGVAVADLRRLLYPPSETANAVYLEPELPALAQVLADGSEGQAGVPGAARDAGSVVGRVLR